MTSYPKNQGSTASRKIKRTRNQKEKIDPRNPRTRRGGEVRAKRMQSVRNVPHCKYTFKQGRIISGAVAQLRQGPRGNGAPRGPTKMICVHHKNYLNTHYRPLRKLGWHHGAPRAFKQWGPPKLFNFGSPQSRIAPGPRTPLIRAWLSQVVGANDVGAKQKQNSWLEQARQIPMQDV